MTFQPLPSRMDVPVWGESHDACYARGVEKIAAGLGFDPKVPPRGVRVSLKLDIDLMETIGGLALGWTGTMTATVENEPAF